MEFTASILALIVGFGGGYLFGTRRGASSDGVSRAEYDKIIKEVSRLDGQRGALETQLAELRSSLDERSEALRKKSEEAASASAERKLLDDRIAKMEEQLKLQFENLANKVLDKNSVKFNEQSKNSLQELLNPLKERLAEFQKKVDDSFGTQAKEQFSLKEEIKRIVDVNEKMRLQTDGLTKALRGDVKAQGNWGEVMLERILEDAGAQEGFAYIAQGEGMGLKHVEDGSTLKPDYVVKLPDNKHLIIDSLQGIADTLRAVLHGRRRYRQGRRAEALLELHPHPCERAGGAPLPGQRARHAGFRADVHADRRRLFTGDAECAGSA